MESVETSTQEGTDAVVTRNNTTDNSLGLRTPHAGSVELEANTPTSASSAATASLRSSVQEAPETSIDPLSIATAVNMKDDKTTEELLGSTDKAMTGHLSVLIGLSCLETLFANHTRGERIEAAGSTLCASEKSMRRDDIPVSSCSDSMPSLGETEAPRLRVSVRSCDGGSSRSVSALDFGQNKSQRETSRYSAIQSRLQATVLQKSSKPELSNDCASPPGVMLVSPAAFAAAATDDVRAERQAAPLSADVDVHCSTPTHAPSQALSVAPKRHTAVGETPAAAAVTTSPAALRCPQVVGQEPFHNGRCGRFDSLQEHLNAPALRTCVSMPTPPPTIDVILAETTPKFLGAKRSSGANGATSIHTTSSACPALFTLSAAAAAAVTTTSSSHPSVNASLFLPKRVLSAQLPATGDAAAVEESWCPIHYGCLRHQPGVFEVPAADPQSISEDLVNQIPTDATASLMHPTLDLFTGSSWGGEKGVARASNRGTVAPSSMPVDVSLFTRLCKEGSRPPSCPPKPLGSEMPRAPHACDSSLKPTVCGPGGASSSCPGLGSPSTLAPFISPEKVIHSNLGGFTTMRPSLTATQSPSCFLPKVRRRHDPYSPTGFVLCEESSSNSGLSHTDVAAARASLPFTALRPPPLPIDCSTGLTRMTKKFFEDPLIKAPASFHEHRHRQRADSTLASSAERQSVSHLIADAVPDRGGDDGLEEAPAGSQLSCDELVTNTC
ncbi:hypothetical protein JKF63_02698 [Porcisia hertigi]|uniref:Uncharacterized protein n=1 Tax=Porcisia hertigi TaxID=2761500 RepID=A0A836HNL3_9TRYP|nr:hypothetical protein JKF63_02698 [Porcisia hertigi]